MTCLPSIVLRVLAIVVVIACGPAMAQDAYRLSENDELRLIGPDLPGIAGVYRLGEGGRMALPIQSPPVLEGLSIAEATATVRAALEAETVAPRIGLELVARRPFYILGDVASPGAFPGQSGLTLARAMALAGGAYRSPEGNTLATSVTQIRAREDRDQAVRERAEAQIQLIRIEADLAGRKALDLPGSLHDLQADTMQVIIERETAMLVATSDAYAERIDSIKRLRAARKAEIDALEQRLEGAERQTEQIEDEVADVRKLLTSGLTPVSRLSSLIREADSQKSGTLQINVMLNQARQALAQLELDGANLPRERRTNLMLQAQEVTARIATLDRRIEAASEVLATAEQDGHAPAGNTYFVFDIQRADGTHLPETQDTSVILHPGDLVTVRRRAVADRVAQ